MPDAAIAPSPVVSNIRVSFRSTDGSVELDWPAERIADALADADGTLWIDIEELNGDLRMVEALFRDVFHFHPLAIDDALQECNVPKVDDWNDHLYLVVHAIDFDPDTDDLRLHEVDLFLGANYLVTYHTEPIGILDALRRQLERDQGERLKRGPDHLLYHVLDRVTAEFLTAIEHLDEAIDAAQDEVLHDPSPETMRKILRVKRSALRIHRIIAPQREVVNRLARDEYKQIDARDRVYFRDVYDHLVRLHDITETLRDLISGALDTYLSALANRTNEVMKLLTVVTIMFLPLNFLVGFFGMNFFGDTLAFTWPVLPKTLLFVLGGGFSFVAPLFVWIWAKRHDWV